MKSINELENPNFLKTHINILDLCLPTPCEKAKTPQEQYTKLKSYIQKIGIDPSQLIVSACTYLTDEFLPEYKEDPNPTIIKLANTSSMLGDETQQYQFLISTVYTALHSSLTPDFKSTIQKSKVFCKQSLDAVIKSIADVAPPHESLNQTENSNDDKNSKSC